MTPELGVKLLNGGANVAVFSANATQIYFCIFENEIEIRRVLLNQRDGDIHFAFIENVKQGTCYGLRADGPWDIAQGHRFDVSKLLVDPFATTLDRPFTYNAALSQKGVDTASFMPKCIVESEYADVARPKYRKPDFIYELPVKAFTKLHPDVPKDKRGTIAALAEACIINHLKMIGVDTIELMPITAWIDERHLQPHGLQNAWGYNPVQFTALEPKLAPGGFDELRKTIKKLHQENFRIILDVVLNHSGESDQFGPTLCFRGLDNATYYSHTHGALNNDTGCGNTLNLNHPHLIALVIKSLRHWVLKAGVDGFRFDLGTVMGRMADGFHKDAPLLRAIETDDVLSTCIMIAEPWDIGPGGYQLGNFPDRWQEWNDRFRDDGRRFWRGDNFSANNLATRLAGSSDIFTKPSRSLNFISAHDGFTLGDLTHYSQKNNLANGEENRDGKNDEVTWLGGSAKTLLATLFLSRGTPMLTAGDEFGRSQKGNNNAYAQDNETTWLDWSGKDETLIAHVAELAALRKRLSIFHTDHILADKSEANWFDENGTDVNWSNPNQRFLGLLYNLGKKRLALIANGANGAYAFPMRGKTWQKTYCSAIGPDCPAQSMSVFEES
jgi:glycogen debranching enzyme